MDKKYKILNMDELFDNIEKEYQTELDCCPDVAEELTIMRMNIFTKGTHIEHYREKPQENQEIIQEIEAEISLLRKAMDEIVTVIAPGKKEVLKQKNLLT